MGRFGDGGHPAGRAAGVQPPDRREPQRPDAGRGVGRRPGRRERRGQSHRHRHALARLPGGLWRQPVQGIPHGSRHGHRQGIPLPGVVQRLPRHVDVVAEHVEQASGAGTLLRLERRGGANRAAARGDAPGPGASAPGGNWPTDRELRELGEPAGLVLHWVHFPYLPSGKTFHSGPVVVQAHEGDWHAAAKIYRQWFAGRFPLRPNTENWLRREQVVQYVMFMLAEGDVLHTFKDIPALARGGEVRRQDAHALGMVDRRARQRVPGLLARSARGNMGRNAAPASPPATSWA